MEDKLQINVPIECKKILKETKKETFNFIEFLFEQLLKNKDHDDS